MLCRMTASPEFDRLLAQYERGVLSDDVLSEWIEIDDADSGPFNPSLKLKASPGDGPPRRGAAIEQLGESLVPTLNRASRRRRRSIFLDRIAGNFDGHVIISEGDSWFQFPVLRKDVIDHLIEDRSLAILSLGGAGSTAAQMVAQGELREAAAQYQPDFVLVSAGGNDVLAEGGLEFRLNVTDALLSDNGSRPIDFLSEAFFASLQQVLADIRRLLSDVTDASPDSRILIHGYDHVWPRHDGIWLGTPMRNAGITDQGLQRRILRLMLNTFNTELRKLAEAFQAVTWVDMRGEVGRDRWFDELHPDDEGYAAVSREFRRVLRSARS